MTDLAARLAAAAAGPHATDAMIARLAADAELMRLAAADMDAAVRALTERSIVTAEITAEIVADRLTQRKDAA